MVWLVILMERMQHEKGDHRGLVQACYGLKANLPATQCINGNHPAALECVNVWGASSFGGVGSVFDAGLCWACRQQHKTSSHNCWKIRSISICWQVKVFAGACFVAVASSAGRHWLV